MKDCVNYIPYNILVLPHGEKRSAVIDRPSLKKPKFGSNLRGAPPSTRLAGTLKKPFKTPLKDITPLIDCTDSPQQSEINVLGDDDEVIVLDHVDDEPVQLAKSPEPLVKINEVEGPRFQGGSDDNLDSIANWRQQC